MYSVYQHWDPLQVCVVGRSYPPEFYSWITVPHVRSLFERIAQETEEDYQSIIKILERFGVKVLRPKIPSHVPRDRSGRYLPPPMTPRDHMIMIGNKFYHDFDSTWATFYQNVRDSSWNDYDCLESFLTQAPDWQIQELRTVHQLDQLIDYVRENRYDDILDHLRAHDTPIFRSPDPNIVNGAMVSRIGLDLYFSTQSYLQDTGHIRRMANKHFQSNRNHVINTGGHGDGTYCPVCPGLIVSLHDVPTYAESFPNWEVVYLPGQSWDQVSAFTALKKRNKGKWWIPGFEHDSETIDLVETWLSHWTGLVEETVFDVNMLIIDTKNAVVFNENDKVFEAFARYGITPHVVPFRHRYFWDGGIHCVTADLHRLGQQQNFFPNRQ